MAYLGRSKVSHPRAAPLPDVRPVGDLEACGHREQRMSSYTRYPKDGPSRRAVWIIIWFLIVAVAANLADQAGIL
jgi:hypothetical protein